MSAVLKSLGQNSRGKRGGKTFHTPMWNLLPGFFYVLRRLNTTFQQRGLLEFIGGPSQSGRFKLNAERWWVIAAGYEMKVFSWHLTKCHVCAASRRHEVCKHFSFTFTPCKLAKITRRTQIYIAVCVQNTEKLWDDNYSQDFFVEWKCS